MKQYGRKIKALWNQKISEGFWSEWWGSNPRASRSQTARSINWTTPGNQKIVYQKKQKKSFHCGQNCGKNKAFHHFDSIRRAEKHCAARVSGIWEKPLEHHTTMSQMSRATNCTTPGYLVVMIIARKSCDWKFFPVCSHLCGQSGFWLDFSAQKNSANACVARGSGLWLFLSWIGGKSLPNHPRYQLR